MVQQRRGEGEQVGEGAKREAFSRGSIQVADFVVYLSSRVVSERFGLVKEIAQEHTISKLALPPIFEEIPWRRDPHRESQKEAF